MFRVHTLDLIMLGLYSMVCNKPCCITHGILPKFAKLGWHNLKTVFFSTI